MAREHGLVRYHRRTPAVLLSGALLLAAPLVACGSRLSHAEIQRAQGGAALPVPTSGSAASAGSPSATSSNGGFVAPGEHTSAGNTASDTGVTPSQINVGVLGEQVQRARTRNVLGVLLRRDRIFRCTQPGRGRARPQGQGRFLRRRGHRQRQRRLRAQAHRSGPRPGAGGHDGLFVQRRVVREQEGCRRHRRPAGRQRLRHLFPSLVAVRQSTSLATARSGGTASFTPAPRSTTGSRCGAAPSGRRWCFTTSHRPSDLLCRSRPACERGL